MKAERIVVVDGGRIVETGSHDELVARGGRYAEMYATWSAQLELAA
jgi:ABC-type multidrug transport system fused ATPase/permease subunit